MQKFFTFFISLLLGLTTYSQIPSGAIGIGTNPFSVAEPSFTIGVAGYYQLSKSLGIMAEPSFISGNSYMLPSDWDKIKGYRMVI